MKWFILWYVPYHYTLISYASYAYIGHLFRRFGLINVARALRSAAQAVTVFGVFLLFFFFYYCHFLPFFPLYYYSVSVVFHHFDITAIIMIRYSSIIIRIRYGVGDRSNFDSDCINSLNPSHKLLYMYLVR